MRWLSRIAAQLSRSAAPAGAPNLGSLPTSASYSSRASANPDVIIVGAGHNGLVAAALLARQGLAVHCVEAKDVIGGACRTGTLYVWSRPSMSSRDMLMYVKRATCL